MRSEDVGHAANVAVEWVAHWAGSNPYKGWSIRCGREEIAWLGEAVSSEDLEAIVLAHNKCFDCEGAGCVMNCSGLRAAEPMQPSEPVTCTHPSVCQHAYFDNNRWNCAKCMAAGLEEPPAGVAADVHLDDWWVDLFAGEMKSKLANARDKGRGGWQDCDPAELSNMLREHVEKGDPRDVANFCMFLWALRSPISVATHLAQTEQAGK